MATPQIIPYRYYEDAGPAVDFIETVFGSEVQEAFIYALNTDLDRLYAEMITKKQAGVYELAWFGENPVWIPVSLTVIQIAVGVGGYVGSLLFFGKRREARNA